MQTQHAVQLAWLLPFDWSLMNWGSSMHVGSVSHSRHSSVRNSQSNCIPVSSSMLVIRNMPAAIDPLSCDILMIIIIIILVLLSSAFGMPFLLAPQMKQSGFGDIEIPQCWQQLPASTPWLHWATALMVFFNFFLTDRHTVIRCPSFCRKHVPVCTCYVPRTGYTNHIALVNCVNQRLCRGADLRDLSFSICARDCDWVRNKSLSKHNVKHALICYMCTPNASCWVDQ